MNTVNLCGKIHAIKDFGNVLYLTIHCKDSRNNEFLDVTIFDGTFFNRHFCKGMWIGILGHIHKNKYKDYKQEIIADSLYFVGDAPTPEDEFKELDVDPETGEILSNPFNPNHPQQAVADTPTGRIENNV